MVTDRIQLMAGLSIKQQNELVEENRRLRAALEDIASGRYSGVMLTSLPPQDAAVTRARAALEGK